MLDRLFHQLPNEVTDRDDFLIYVDTESPEALADVITKDFARQFPGLLPLGSSTTIDFEHSPYLKYDRKKLELKPAFFRYETLVAATPREQVEGHAYFREVAALIFLIVARGLPLVLVSDPEDTFLPTVAHWRAGGGFESFLSKN